MKCFYNGLLATFLLFLSTHVQANHVTVKGTIKNSAGAFVANKTVTISIAATGANASCTASHQVTTNSGGFYTDELECTNADITKVETTVEDCTGQKIVHADVVPASKIVESNFTLCIATPPTNCEAVFTVTTTTNPYEIKFNSSTAHGTSSADAIVKRRWTFGDGAVSEGNEVSPSHIYTKAGVYEVCLTITTAAGCESKKCTNVTITLHNCAAKFSVSQLASSTIAIANFKFNSNVSETATNDNITERLWDFGDGIKLGGNIIDPTHAYSQPGNYNVCLTIRTSGGCSSTNCISIQVPPPPVVCKADFSAATAGKTAKFNSINSQPANLIISRRWSFGDGEILEGNIKDPSHEYSRPGVYQVCVTIKTATCENTQCKQITVGESTTRCAAQFSFEKQSPKKIAFNSIASIVAANDAVIERDWDFGDGSPTLSGNEAKPVKEYAAVGAYNVCLTIKTANGCESKICVVVHIEDGSATNNDLIKIVLLYPTPVHANLMATVWSLNDIQGSISIVDVYGNIKYTASKFFTRGNNVLGIPTETLTAGPYFFKVTTMYGVKSKEFYKL